MRRGVDWRHHAARAFSIIELVIVVAILGVISAIAMPRLSRAGDASRESSLIANMAILQSAIDRYTAEHGGLSPGHSAPGSVDPSGAAFRSRLEGVTLDNGTPGAGGIFGPYLRQVPANPLNGLRTVRVGGAAAGAGTHGWRFDPVTESIESDHIGALVLGGGGGGGGGEVEVGGVLGGAELGAGGVLGGGSLKGLD
jgi:prepilin-type N-terminal cleavage/methylation domain-containing protein